MLKSTQFALAILLFVCTQSAFAEHIFLTLAGSKGDPLLVNIPLTSFDWGLTSADGECSQREIKIVKSTDAVSADFILGAVTGQAISSASILLTTPSGRRGGAAEILRLTLSDVTISEYNVTSDEESSPTDSIVLKYESLSGEARDRNGGIDDWHRFDTNSCQ